MGIIDLDFEVIQHFIIPRPTGPEKNPSALVCANQKGMEVESNITIQRLKWRLRGSRFLADP